MENAPLPRGRLQRLVFAVMPGAAAGLGGVPGALIPWVLGANVGTVSWRVNREGRAFSTNAS
jgi:hypothetical protein